MQLERLLHAQGFGSRRHCCVLIRQGRVMLGGTPCMDPFAEVEPDGLHFELDAQARIHRVKAYLDLNKPARCECSARPLHHPSVRAVLPPEPIRRGVQPEARLNQDTAGLLLLSDDGQFIHALTSPRRRIPKVCEVITRHPVSAAQLAAAGNRVEALHSLAVGGYRLPESLPPGAWLWIQAGEVLGPVSGRA